MELNLNGKIAIVTGASRGIGAAIARNLAGEGVRLVLVARTSDHLESLAATLPTDCLVQALDLRDPQVPAEVISAALTRFGRIDILVNNAGATRRGDFLALPDEDWADGFALKFFGAMRCCRAAWPHLVACQGAIVNIIGVGGRMGNADFTIGGSVNSALINLTKSLADRGVQEGVRINAINPGSIRTDRLQIRIRSFAQQHGLDETQAAVELAKIQGVTRFGTSDEIARAVTFLVSPQASYINGAILDVDGGQTRAL